jgi:uncharacterized membrane protein
LDIKCIIYVCLCVCVCVMLCALSITSKWWFNLVIDTDTCYVLSFIKQKKNYYSYKLRYKGYLELIYKCLSYDMCTELTHIRILYGEITCVYRKAHMIIV